MADLLELAKRVENLTGPDREVDGLIEIAVTFSGNDGYEHVRGRFYANHRRAVPVHEAPAYTASLDAAMQLVPEGWLWNAGGTGTRGGARCWRTQDAPDVTTAATPALALCAAALRARAEVA